MSIPTPTTIATAALAYNGSAQADPQPLTLTSAINTGDDVWVGGFIYTSSAGTGVITVTDDASNSYSTDINQVETTGGFTFLAHCHTATALTASGGHKISVTHSGAIYEFLARAITVPSSYVIASALDQTASAASTGTTGQSVGPTGTLAQTDEFALAVFAGYFVTTPGETFAPGGSYSQIGSAIVSPGGSTAVWALAMAWLETSAVTAQTATGTWSIAAGGSYGANLIATYKGVTVGATVALQLSSVSLNAAVTVAPAAAASLHLSATTLAASVTHVGVVPSATLRLSSVSLSAVTAFVPFGGQAILQLSSITLNAVERQQAAAAALQLSSVSLSGAVSHVGFIPSAVLQLSTVLLNGTVVAPVVAAAALQLSSIILSGAGYYAVPLPPLADIPAALAGSHGVTTPRLRFYQVDRVGNVLNELSAAVELGGTVNLNNDQSVARTISLTLDARKLPAAFINAPATQFNIAVAYEVLQYGTWLSFPLGTFWIDRPKEQVTPATRIWTVQGADFTNILNTGKSAPTYSVASGTDYLAAINTIATARGLRCAVTSVGITTPVAFTWQPNTSWLQICNDLLAGINYYPLWIDTANVLRTRARTLPQSEVASITYTTDADPRMIVPPFDQGIDISQPENQLNVIIDDPLRSLQNVLVTNADATSPVSTATLGYIAGAEIRGSGSGYQGTKCLVSITTGGAVGKVELSLADALAHPAQLLTHPDPRRGAFEYYGVTISDVRGAPVVSNQLYRVASWTFDLNLGGVMTHVLERVNPLVLT